MSSRCRYYVLGVRVPRWLWRLAPFWPKWQEWRGPMSEPLPRDDRRRRPAG